MGNRNNSAKQRALLYSINPFCYYCFVRTIFKVYTRENCSRNSNDCTIEHIYSRLNLIRKNKEVYNSIALLDRIKTCCYSCNQKKSREEGEKKHKNQKIIEKIRGKYWIQVRADFDWFDRF